MLRELYIENLAVIEKLNVRFLDGMTVFTGETGAGKSILIDAINLVLGQRSNKEIVRSGAPRAYVSAVFEALSPELEAVLSENGFSPEDGQLIVSREVSADGRGTARMMERPVTVSFLREIGTRLINIHGQHDNQILLSSEHHVDILDDFAANGRLLAAYQKEYHLFSSLKEQFRKLSLDEQEKARRIDLLSFQTEEIAEVMPKPGEDESLESTLHVIRNAQKISDTISAVYASLRGYEGGSAGIYDQLNQVCEDIDGLAEYAGPLRAASEQLHSALYEVEDASGRLSDFLDNFEYDPGELEQLEQRLDNLLKLKRKYGSTMDEVLAYYDKSVQELEEIQLSEQQQETLRTQIESQKHKVMEAGKRLSSARQKAAKRFASQVSQQLVFLDMPNISMKVSVEKGKYGAKGCDLVEILFSTNRGEEMKSISKIASGGELSRIMLAVKSVLAEKDSIDTLIFDEIDTGVSGSSAQKIGLKLKGVASHRQVLCVTHSAQIAALSHHNFLIRKETEKGRTFTRIFGLDEEQKVEEVARIMSTGEISELLRENAREMVERAKQTDDNGGTNHD